MYDIIVIGGGITGAGVARDAAVRGLSCLLLEKDDFASGVSSKSTRLIHGGLRYLANFEVDLVAEALRERAILRRQAPYLIEPTPILIPIYKGDAHGRAVISLGVHLYDMLSRESDIPHYFTSGREKTLTLAPALNQEGLHGSALFYDHQIMMPERLVIENIISAREAGAVVLNHTKAEKIAETDEAVVVTARDEFSKEVLTVRGRTLINAAGPWIDQVRSLGDFNGRRIINPTKGIHLVMRKLTEQALFIASRDGRMFFIIPLGEYSLIGTTDTKYSGDLDEVHADSVDVGYLLTESKRVLPGLNLSREAVLYTYAGIRPLAFSGSSESKISRKHRVIREGRTGRVFTIAGGKLTTYRNMAKDVVDAACRFLRVRTACSTDTAPLPGSLQEPYQDYLKQAVPDLAAEYRVDENTIRHLIRFYGARIKSVLELTKSNRALSVRVSPESADLYAQIIYSIVEEGARTLSDIVFRRIHTGMTGSRGINQIEKIASFAGQTLKWNKEEIEHQIANFRKDVNRERECLK